MTVPKQLRLKSAALENVFCYREVAVDFLGGVSVFSGANGSGKSSLLEAIFFGLFGSSTKVVTGRDLGQVLRDGSRKGSLEVSFTLGEDQYTVHLALKRANEEVKADGPNCSLNRNGATLATGATETAKQVELLLNMNKEDFAHCLYVRQGEVDQLIRASHEDRQSIIDRLLRLTKIDEYKQRLDKESSRALNRRTGKVAALLADREKARKELTSADFPAQKTQLQKELAQLDAQRNEWSNRQAQAQEEKRKLEDIKSRFQQTLQKVQQLQAHYKQRKAEYDQSNAQLQRLKDEIQGLKAEHLVLQNEWKDLQRLDWWQTLGLSPQTSLQDRVEELEQETKQMNESLQERARTLAGLQAQMREKGKALKHLETDAQKKAKEMQRAGSNLEQLDTVLKQQLGKLHIRLGALEALDLEELIAQQKAIYEQEKTQHAALTKKEAELEAQQKGLQKHLKEAQDLIRAGRCPTCQQAITTTTLSAHTDPLRVQLADCTQQLDIIKQESKACGQRLKQAEAKLSQLRDGLQPCYQKWLEAQREHNRVSQETQESKQHQATESAALEVLAQQETPLNKEIAQLRQRREGLEESLKRLKNAQDIEKSLENQRERIGQLQEQQGMAARLCDTHKQELSNLQRHFEELTSEWGELNIQQLEAAIKQWEQTLKDIQEKLKVIDEKRSDLKKQEGQIDEKWRQLEAVTAEIKQYTEQLSQLNSLEAEIQRLGDLYERIRLTLRQQNLAALNQVFNKFFKLMDPSPAYERIELNQDFDIEVVRTDEQRMSPSILSGGERALINLALRAAIHAVISEAGGVLLPLLFDEPTVFLDQNHVRQLEHLFTELGSRAGQVIVVSHEASLVESADHEYRVSKDADNLGRVEKVR